EARDLGSVSPLGSSPRSLVAPRLSSRHGCRFRWGQIAALEPFERWFEMEHERTLPVTDDPRECRTTRSSRFRQTTPLRLEAETRAPPPAPSRRCHFLARLPPRRHLWSIAQGRCRDLHAPRSIAGSIARIPIA